MMDDELIAEDAITLAKHIVEEAHRATLRYPGSSCASCRAVLLAVATNLAADLCEQLMEQKVDRDHYDIFEMIMDNVITSASYVSKGKRTIQ